jgi:hypothetical protein
MRCMSCSMIVPRKHFCLCHGCKAWYCKECFEDHNPCNKGEETEETSQIEEVLEEIKIIDDSKPGIWVLHTSNDKPKFDFWSHVAA